MVFEPGQSQFHRAIANVAERRSLPRGQKGDARFLAEGTAKADNYFVSTTSSPSRAETSIQSGRLAVTSSLPSLAGAGGGEERGA